jgi:DNA-binding NtrC family response regulator
MVYGFAKRSGGGATIASQPGHGTTVKLYLPRTEDTVERSVTDDLPSPPPPLADSETVLVVEDDPDVRTMTEAMLKNLGYRVLSVEGARVGLDILLMESAKDSMNSDVVLPGGMSGPDMAEQANALRPEIKTLFISGHAQESAHLQSMLPEGCDLLDKPFRTFELAKRVRAALDR